MPHPRIPALIRLHLGLSAWPITGATSGFGRRVAERALQNGAHVIAVGRRAADLPARAGLAPLALDIIVPEAEEVLRAADAAGWLDVLVNKAGYGLFGSVEQTPVAEARAVIDTNVLANLAVLQATLPALRASHGRIVQVSSLAGQFAWASSGIYSASKVAVELLSDHLGAGPRFPSFARGAVRARLRAERTLTCD
jgi:NADP-dependent 3-hydroxy acid dehydrogenase YdfG